MANDSGTMKYWFEGSPEGTTQILANNSGTMKYWFEGSPEGEVYQASSGGTVAYWRTLLGMGA